MSYQTEREQFIVAMTQAGMPYYVATKLLRYASTLHRLAEAQCNGDYPADNGERKVVPCSRCESLWVRSSMVQDQGAPKIAHPPHTAKVWVPLICRDCRTVELVHAAIPPGFGISTQGDPRGYVLRISHNEREYGVPTR